MNSPEQTLPIRNERVISSNLISGSPLFQEDYLLKMTYLDLLAKVTEGNVWTPKVAFRCPKNGYLAVADSLWQERVRAKFSVSVRPYDCKARPQAKWVLNFWHPTGKKRMFAVNSESRPRTRYLL